MRKFLGDTLLGRIISGVSRYEDELSDDESKMISEEVSLSPVPEPVAVVATRDHISLDHIRQAHQTRAMVAPAIQGRVPNSTALLDFERIEHQTLTTRPMTVGWTLQSNDDRTRVLSAVTQRVTSNARDLTEMIRGVASGSEEDLEEKRIEAAHGRLTKLLKREIKDGAESYSYTYALFQYLLGEKSAGDRRIGSVEINNEDDEYDLTLTIRYPVGYIDNITREGISPLVIPVSLAEENSEYGPRFVQKFTFNILQKQANGRYKTEQEIEEGFKNLEVFFEEINQEYEKHNRERASSNYALSEIKKSLKKINLILTTFPIAINNLDDRDNLLPVGKRLPFKAKWPKGKDDVVERLCRITQGVNFEFIKITRAGIEITAIPTPENIQQIHEGLIFDFVKLDEVTSKGFIDREVEEKSEVIKSGNLGSRDKSRQEEQEEINRWLAEIEGEKGNEEGAAAGAGGPYAGAGAGSSSSRRSEKLSKSRNNSRSVKASVNPSIAVPERSYIDYVDHEENNGDGWFRIDHGKAKPDSLEEAKKNLKEGKRAVTTPVAPLTPATLDSPKLNSHTPSVFAHKLLFLKKGIKVLGDFGWGVEEIIIPEDTLVFPTVKYYAPQGFVMKRMVTDSGISTVEYDSIIPQAGGGKFLALKKDSVILVINPDNSFTGYKIGKNAVLVPCREVDKMLIESVKKDSETAAKMDIFNYVSDISNLTHQNILFLLRDTWKKSGRTDEQCDYNLSHGGISVAVISQDPALDYSLRNAMLDFLNHDLDRASIILGRGNLIKNEIEGNSHWTSLHLRRVAYGDRFIIQAYHIDSLGSLEIPDAVTRVLNSINNLKPKDLSEDDRERYQRAIGRLSSSQYCFNGQCNAGFSTIQADNYSCGYHAAFNAVASFINNDIAVAPLNVIWQDDKETTIEEFIAEKKEILKQKFNVGAHEILMTTKEVDEDDSKLTYKARILSIIIGGDDHLTKLEKLILLEREIKAEGDEAILKLSSLQIETSYKKILSDYAVSLKYSTKDMIFSPEVSFNISLFLEELCSAKVAQNPEKILPFLKRIEEYREVIYSFPEKLLLELNNILESTSSEVSSVAQEKLPDTTKQSEIFQAVRRELGLAQPSRSSSIVSQAVQEESATMLERPSPTISAMQEELEKLVVTTESINLLP